ncbi:endonuclease NucS [Haloarcula pelagica]|uniref:endonuclease NucS n=1 Tax=Haloarcula pelagica TaxID=3033389 RepID=UPI0024C2774E|nr:endonuclease NucS [Halomicroarcula sp. YJ-61-S]
MTAESAVETLSYPAPDTARDLVQRGIDRGAMVTLFGRCAVEYEGRAASSLAPGDRHITLKPDGAALVHTDEGQQPVNWQPPGCDHAVAVTDAGLVVRSTRETPAEELEITFERVAHAAAFDVSDPEDLALTGTEADLKERILDAPALVEDGLTPLATERETPAGAVDIYAEDAAGRTVVLELKRRRVGPDAVGQLDRYVDALARELHTETEVRGILVAPSLTDRARQLLAEKGLEFVALEPP